MHFVKLAQSHRSSLPEYTICNRLQYVTLPKNFSKAISKINKLKN